MTKLIKPVRRETVGFWIKRPLIIQIEPPNIIRIREKGRRRWFETTVERVFKGAVRDWVEQQQAERKKERKRQGMRNKESFPETHSRS
jgi:hypothetical protein